VWIRTRADTNSCSEPFAVVPNTLSPSEAAILVLRCVRKASECYRGRTRERGSRLWDACFPASAERAKERASERARESERERESERARERSTARRWLVVVWLAVVSSADGLYAVALRTGVAARPRRPGARSGLPCPVPACGRRGSQAAAGPGSHCGMEFGRSRTGPRCLRGGRKKGLV
jgi:hypothetical protein